VANKKPGFLKKPGFSGKEKYLAFPERFLYILSTTKIVLLYQFLISPNIFRIIILKFQRRK